jgi:hypothetical protein
MSEIIFEVCEDDGRCYTAAAYSRRARRWHRYPKATLEESRATVKDAVDCYLDEIMEAPKVIRLNFVLDEA